MRIQGWIHPVVMAVCGDSPASTAGTGSAGSTGRNKTSSPVDRGRLELLASIRMRIKAGFYNSDAVIDDIGHGFAQALDSTI